MLVLVTLGVGVRVTLLVGVGVLVAAAELLGVLVGTAVRLGVELADGDAGTDAVEVEVGVRVGVATAELLGVPDGVVDGVALAGAAQDAGGLNGSSGKGVAATSLPKSSGNNAGPSQIAGRLPLSANASKLPSCFI